MAQKNPNTLAFLVSPRKISFWLLLGLLGIYCLLCAVIFLQWVNPSLTGKSDQRIAADSGTYIYMADGLRDGRAEPWVYAALASFPNTLWMPVLLAFAIPNTFWMAGLNLAIFGTSIQLFRKTAAISTGLFVALLVLNPTTTISILSVNKEIVDLFAVAIFCFGLARKRKWMICVALFLSLLNRYEVCLAMMVLLFVQSRFNPLRRHRNATVAIFVVLLTILLPAFASHALSNRFEEASNAGLIAVLDGLEMHYLFFLAVVPKVLEAMFGELLNSSHWAQYSSDDLANSYILFLSNLSFFAAILALIVKKQFTIRSDWMYFAVLGAILMSVSLVIQPRYYYYCYVLICFQVAHRARVRGYRALPSASAGEGYENVWSHAG